MFRGFPSTETDFKPEEAPQGKGQELPGVPSPHALFALCSADRTTQDFATETSGRLNLKPTVPVQAIADGFLAFFMTLFSRCHWEHFDSGGRATFRARSVDFTLCRCAPFRFHPRH
jgi:hypothetical protein